MKILPMKVLPHTLRYWFIALALCAVSIACVPTAVHAAVVHVQDTSGANSATTSVSATWASPTTAGNLLVAIVGYRAGSTITLTPPAGGWVVAKKHENGSTIGIAIYYMKNAASQSGTVTWNLSGAANATLQLAEYAGIDQQAPLDVVSSTTGTSTTASTQVSPTTNQNDELVLAGFTAANGDAAFSTAIYTYTEVSELSSTGGALATDRNHSAVDEKIVTSTGGQFATAAFSGSAAAWAAALATFKADVTPPTVTNVSSSLSNGTYGTGQVIPITVTFSEPVFVTGLPRLVLSTGSPATTAIDYSSGSGTTTLTFVYTVAAGNTSVDLDYAGTNALVLNSGAIQDSAGNDSVVTLPTVGGTGSLGANKALSIDGVAPVLAEVTPVPTPSAGGIVSYTFSTTKAGTISYGGSCSSLTTDAVVGENTVSFAMSPNPPFSNGVTYSDCTVAITDALGNSSAILSVSPFVVDTTAPYVYETTPVETPTADTTPSYIFTTDEAGTIAYAGGCASSTATSATVGANTIDFDALADGTYAECTITVTDAVGNTSEALLVTSFTVASVPDGTLSVHFDNVDQNGTSVGGTIRIYYTDGSGPWVTSAPFLFSLLDGSTLVTTTDVDALAVHGSIHYPQLPAIHAGNVYTVDANTGQLLAVEALSPSAGYDAAINYVYNTMTVSLDTVDQYGQHVVGSTNVRDYDQGTLLVATASTPLEKTLGVGAKINSTSFTPTLGGSGTAQYSGIPALASGNVYTVDVKTNTLVSTTAVPVGASYQAAVQFLYTTIPFVIDTVDAHDAHVDGTITVRDYQTGWRFLPVTPTPSTNPFADGGTVVFDAVVGGQDTGEVVFSSIVNQQRYLYSESAAAFVNTIAECTVYCVSFELPPATLHVVTLVDNTGGGTATASDFTVHVQNAGVDVAASPQPGADGGGTTYTLAAGDYTVNQDAAASYTTVISGDCGSDGTITLATSAEATCTITNTYIPPATTATKFFIVDPADADAGTPVTVTVEARNADDSIDTSYQADVTLVTTGFASGSGLVDIIDGVGRLTLNDNVPETVTLSLIDTEGTGLDSSSVQNLVFYEPVGPVVKFSIEDPADVYVGGTATVTVRALRADNTVDTNYQADVTLHTTGDAVGAGVVDIINGIGTVAVSDTTVENVVLSLSDSDATGLDVSSVQDIWFRKRPSGTKTPPPPPTTIIFSGNAYPDSTLTIVKKDANNSQEIPVKNAFIAQRSGVFSETFFELPIATTATYGIVITDREGRRSQTKFYTIDIKPNKTIETKILATPTISAIQPIISTKDALLVRGYATPGNTVTITIDDKKIITDGKTESDGSYEFSLPVSDFTVGEHTLRAVQLTRTGIASEYSPIEHFTISKFAIPKADLNGDGIIDISDWSRFLSLWLGGTAEERSAIDMNGDRKITISDFSIFSQIVKQQQ